jgi:hypothetical protein
VTVFEPEQRFDGVAHRTGRMQLPPGFVDQVSRPT